MPKIALIIRGKFSEDHHPELMEQHADVILADGEPMGFFGESGKLPGIGMGMNGVVYNYDAFMVKRPYYVNMQMAAQLNIISTVCFLDVDYFAGERFKEYWFTQLKNKKFNIVGNNCSTRANEAFVYAKILRGEIPGLDTPNRLYERLKSQYGSRFSCKSGYVGFKKNSNQKFELQILERKNK